MKTKLTANNWSLNHLCSALHLVGGEHLSLYFLIPFEAYVSYLHFLDPKGKGISFHLQNGFLLN